MSGRGKPVSGKTSFMLEGWKHGNERRRWLMLERRGLVRSVRERPVSGKTGNMFGK